MTHDERIEWLNSRGWLVSQPVRPIDLNRDGRLWVCIDGARSKMIYGAWLRLDDGEASLFGSKEDLTWEQFQAKIDRPERETVPARTPVRSLFDD